MTDIPGTTRDTVSETASLGGLPVRFVDTAGLRVGHDPVESLGIERSYQAMADADLTIAVIDRSAPFDAEDNELIDRARRSGRLLVAANKSDLPVRAEIPEQFVAVSALTGEGIEEMRRRILESVSPEASIRSGSWIYHKPAARAASPREPGRTGSGTSGDAGKYSARNAAAGSLRSSASYRCDHRSHYRGRHLEPHFFNVLYWQVTSVEKAVRRSALGFQLPRPPEWSLQYRKWNGLRVQPPRARPAPA